MAKIRKGFVSNSSSSSFIVAFPNYLNEADEVRMKFITDFIEEYEDDYKDDPDEYNWFQSTVTTLRSFYSKGYTFKEYEVEYGDDNLVLKIIDDFKGEIVYEN